MRPEDFLIYDTARAMRQIMAYVSRGYTRWAGGTVSFSRVIRMLDKFHHLYGVLASNSDNRRRRRKGLARCRVVMGIKGHTESSVLWWILLVSQDGDGPVTTLERLADVADKRRRLRIGPDELPYELVHYPRRGAGPTWTWRMPGPQWRGRCKSALALARHRDPTQTQALINMDLHRPGFRGLCAQRRELFLAMQSARRKVHHGAGPLIFPARLPYLRIVRLQGEGIRLADWVAQFGDGIE